MYKYTKMFSQYQSSEVLVQIQQYVFINIFIHTFLLYPQRTCACAHVFMCLQLFICNHCVSKMYPCPSFFSPPKIYHNNHVRIVSYLTRIFVHVSQNTSNLYPQNMPVALYSQCYENMILAPQGSHLAQVILNNRTINPWHNHYLCSSHKLTTNQQHLMQAHHIHSFQPRTVFSQQIFGIK